MAETVEQLRVFIEAEFRHRDELRLATELAATKALEIAQENLTSRLDHSNGMKEMLKDNVALMMPRSETERAIAALRGEMQTDLAPLAARVDAFGRPNWPLMTTLLSVAVGMTVGVWSLFGLQIRAEIAPLTLAVEQIKVGNASRDSQAAENRANISKLEQESASILQRSAAGLQARLALTSDVKTLQENFTAGRATRAATEASFRAKLTEIETQFCASDQLRNVLHAFEMRHVAMLWHKTFPDTVMPTDNAYYPRVCNRVVEAN